MRQPPSDWEPRPLAYTAYHPRWLRQPMSTYWWLQKWSYFAFILRELSCLFVAWFVVFLLMLVRAVYQGEAAYQAFLAWAAGPTLLLVNLVGFGFIVYHAITFFIAAPQAMVVHVGRKKVPGVVVGGAHYLGLIVVSAVMAWVLLGSDRQ